MACELIGAKLLAPFFGTSLYVWAAALGLTLGGLTSGYFIGGRLSRRYVGSYRLLYLVLIAAGLLMVVMPFTSDFIMEKTINLPLEWGAMISLAVFMLPPLAFMGMVSPIIINLLTREVGTAGNSAGNVYAISTLGGILLTFLMGFYVIPEFGLKGPSIIVGSILIVLPLIALLRNRDRMLAPAAVCWGAFLFLSVSAGPEYRDNYKVLYQSEGILGQIKVVDHPSIQITPDERMGRGLIVNNTLQTYVGLDHDLQYSIWSWAHYFPTAASIYPPGTKVLLLGLGGGTLVKQLHQLGMEVDVVEIDRRVWEVSVDYFNMDPNTPVYIDDARHYVRTTDKEYDIIIFDTFLSEAVPEHLLTIEGFQDAREILAPDGMIMINFYGFIEGRLGKAARSVYKTLVDQEFHTEILATPGEEGSRNLIFLASEEEKDFTHTSYKDPNYPEIEDLYVHFLNPVRIDTSDAYVLTDQQPRLSRMYAPAAMSWKKSYNDYYRRHFIK